MKGGVGTSTYIINTKGKQGVRYYDYKRKATTFDEKEKICSICKLHPVKGQNVYWNWKTKTLRHVACDVKRKKKNKQKRK